MGRFSADSPEKGGDPKKRKLDRVEKGKGALEPEQEEHEDEEEEEDGGEGESDGDSDSDRELNFRIDKDVLHCSICFEPLRPPIFQCRNGHVACSCCCPKLSKKCPTCSLLIDGRYRCLALEKVIETMKCTCRYARNGCQATPSFTDKASHEEGCRHATLFCPFNDCAFSGSRQLLAAHAESNHLNSVTIFLYGQAFTVSLSRKELLMVLLGVDGNLFLILNSSSALHGSALSLICIGSTGSQCAYTYELKVQSGGSSLQLKTSAEKVRKWSGDHPTTFLVVPADFCDFVDEIDINICIQKSSGAKG